MLQVTYLLSRVSDRRLRTHSQYDRTERPNTSILVLLLLFTLVLFTSSAYGTGGPWSTNPTVNNQLIGTSLGVQPRIVSCPNGEAIAVFESGGKIYARQCDGNGLATPDWGTSSVIAFGTSSNGAPSYIAATSDGTGGIYMAVMYTAGKIFAQYIDATGTALWGPSGVNVSVNTAAPSALGTNSHPSIAAGPDGAMITWTGIGNDGSGFDRILAQYVDQGGNLLTSSAVVIAPALSGDQGNCDLASQLVHHSWGDQTEYFAVWEDGRNSAAAGSDIYVQGFLNDGTLTYDFANAGDGIPLCGAVGDQRNPKILTHLYYGALPFTTHPLYGNIANFYVVWEDGRNSSTGKDLYVSIGIGSGQEVSGDQFGDGIPLCTAGGDQPYANHTFAMALDYSIASPTLSPDLIVVWADSRGSGDIYGQRLDVGGNRAWAVDGNRIAHGSASSISLCVQAGEALVTYSVSASGLDENLYAQLVSANGQTMWDPLGMPLATGHGSAFSHASAVISGNSLCDASVASVWVDGRANTAL